MIISVGVPEGVRVSDEDLTGLRESMISMLKSIDVPCVELAPVELLALIDDFTSPTTSGGEDVTDYNPFDPIADQAVRRDLEIRVEPTRIVLRTERFRALGNLADGTPDIGEVRPDHFDIRSYAVRNLPRRWGPWETAKLIGDPFIDKLRMPCPVATVLTLQYPDEQTETTKANMKFLRTTSLADSRTARWLPASSSRRPAPAGCARRPAWAR